MANRALVTGALGHTGSFLVKLLAGKGWDVVATDLQKDKRKEVMTKETVFNSKFQYMDISAPNVKFISADLTDKESLKALFKDDIKNYDAIFNPASLYDYFAPLDLLRRINVQGLKNLLEVIEEVYPKDKIPRFLHWSTCGVYGEPEYKKNSKGFPLPSDETEPYNPPNNYSISKKEQELVLKEFASKTGLKYTIIRPGPIYGPYQTYGAFHIFYMLYKLGHMVLPIVSPKQHKLMMPMVHVEDLVDAAYFLWDKKEAFAEAYNVVGDNVTQEDWMEFTFQELNLQYTHIPVWWPVYKMAANALLKFTEREEVKARKWKIRPKFDTPMAGYIVHQYFFSNEKIKKLGFKFRYGNPYEGTRQTIRWYIDHGWFEMEKFEVGDSERVPDDNKSQVISKEVRV
jgi:nucleoside-diphosphate-sugar epimerase